MRSTAVQPQKDLKPEDFEIPKRLQAVLTVERGEDGGAAFRLAKGSTVVGRGSTADIRLADHGMSRRHFEIFYRNLEFRIRDLDSSNGTFLNGSAVADYALRNGDRILAGETVLVFSVSSA